jgi:hypothetical protein
MAHPVGRFKARFFVSLGYAADQWERLRDDILAIARSGSIAGEAAASYGRKFEVDGAMRRRRSWTIKHRALCGQPPNTYEAPMCQEAKEVRRKIRAFRS